MKIFFAMLSLVLLASPAVASLSVVESSLAECLQGCQDTYDSSVSYAQSMASEGKYTETVIYGGTCPRTSTYGGSGPYANLAKCVAVQQICIDESRSDCHAQLQSCCLEEAILSATNARNNCRANCEFRFKDSAPVAPPAQPDESPPLLPPTQPDKAPSLPPCSSPMGTIFNVEGSPKITRGTVSIPISEGQQYCLDDLIETSQGERLFITFNDGNVRFVGGSSRMSISDDTAPDSRGLVTRAIGVIEHIVRDDAAKLNYDTICGGGRAVFSEGSPVMECRDSLRYTPHSSVRYEFSASRDVITVFEGHVEALDISTGEYAIIETGQQYSRNAGASLESGFVHSLDLSTVSMEMESPAVPPTSSGEGCCAPALILLSALAFACRG